MNTVAHNCRAYPHTHTTPPFDLCPDLERLVKSEAELESIRHHIVDMKKLLDS